MTTGGYDLVMRPVSTKRMSKKGRKAILYLDDQPVGDVTVKGWDTSWGYGEFHPQSTFASFAPVFGQWSLLMHAEDGMLSTAAIDELAQAEKLLDSVRARLFFPADSEWVNVAQLTIDGELLEWKEY